MHDKITLHNIMVVAYQFVPITSEISNGSQLGSEITKAFTESVIAVSRS